MSGKALRDKLLRGGTVYGTLIQHTIDPAIVERLPDGLLDFVIVTAEHNALDLADFLALRHALVSKGIACLARTHSRDEADVAKVCDSFDGVVVPYVEDVEQAKRLAAAAVYRPLKGAVLERAITKGEWPNAETKKHIEERNAGTVFIPMIESVPAVENLDAICSIPGVHAVFVGPGDLTVNMGIPKQYDHPDLIAILKRIIDTAEKHHVAAGCWFAEPRQATRTIRQGARLVVFSNDGVLLGDAIDRGFREVRKA